MTDELEIREKFWKALRSDMTFMLGLSGVEDEHAQPMTAQFDDDEQSGNGGPIWIFTSKDVHLVKAMGQRHAAVASFTSKGHELFACLHGELVADNNRAVIDRLWNRFVAAWYEGGKNDPKLQLLRFDLDRAQIWLNENTMLAGVKLLLGRDPKEDYKDKTADVRLHS